MKCDQWQVFHVSHGIKATRLQRGRVPSTPFSLWEKEGGA